MIAEFGRSVRFLPELALPARRSPKPEGPSTQAAPKLAPSKPTPARGRVRSGRPTPERAAEIEKAILTVARTHFLEGGYEATSMEAVAANAQVSKGTLYARYPTKSALLRAVVTEQIKAWTANHVRKGPLPVDFKQRLQYLARGILAAQMAEESLPFHRLALRAAFDEREFSSALYELALAPAIADLTEEIMRGAKDFPMPVLNAEHVARMIQAMLYGWWSERQAAGGATTEEANAYVDRAIDILFYGRAAW